MGSIYLRGRIWWIRYSKAGKDYWESAKSRKKTIATELLKLREGDLANGKEPGITYEKVRFEDLKKDIITDYKHNERKSLQRLEDSMKHLNKSFEGLRVPHITTSRVKAYIQTRLNEGAENGTINRELAALKRMLHLGYQDNKVSRVPFVPMLEESNVRQGFFEHNEYLELLKALPSELRPVVMFGYKTGWRKREILGLRWERVNLKDRLVILTPDETKNKSPRSLYLSEDLLDLLRKQNLRRVKDCPFVFHRNGKQILDFRGAWKKACQDTKLEGKLFHDFRRTAARNLTRSGTQETVAMKITGHKTRSVFDRYNITSQEDIKKAMERQEEYLSRESVTISVTVGDSAAQKQFDNSNKVANITR